MNKINRQRVAVGNRTKALEEIQKENKKILENDIQPIIMVQHDQDDEPFATLVILSQGDPFLTAKGFSAVIQRFVEIMEEKKEDILSSIDFESTLLVSGVESIDEFKKISIDNGRDVRRDIEYAIEKLEYLKNLISIYTDKFICFCDNKKKEGEK